MHKRKNQSLPIVCFVLMGMAAMGCPSDLGDPELINGGDPGGICSYDFECLGVEGRDGLCFMGICALEATPDCSSATACPQGTECVIHEGTTAQVSVCLPSCSSDYTCLGTCDTNDLCVPGDGNYCMEGRCTVGKPPIDPPQGPDYPDEGWDPQECGEELYPCPPFGRARGSVIGDLAFYPANEAAEDLAGADGILRLSDLYFEGPKAILIFGTAGW